MDMFGVFLCFSSICSIEIYKNCLEFSIITNNFPNKIPALFISYNFNRLPGIRLPPPLDPRPHPEKQNFKLHIPWPSNEFN